MAGQALPEGVNSLLDTDLYKLTMQSAVLKWFPNEEVTYAFTNRTPDMRLSREAFWWLADQVKRLEHIATTQEELQWLKKTCPYLSEPYFHFLENFQFRPQQHIQLEFLPQSHIGDPDERGDIHMIVKGKWVDTILYEIPLLALTSEAYFKFIDKDWTYDGQVENAREKGLRLVEAGCIVSEFGSRRRRDYHTHDLILTGLMQAQEEGDRKGWTGKISGTSNVHFAMKYNIHPIGTVAHEWFMGVAAITDNYKTATETALDYWVATFGRGVLSIALTDTFGTPTFLRAFRKPAPLHAVSGSGATSTFPTADATPGERSGTITSNNDDSESQESYASIFNGTRQDSGDPLEFVKTMRRFYDSEGITTKKAIVFSDALNVDRCIQYRSAAIDAGFAPSFGVGTNFTNDFRRTSDRQKSVPMNIVIKLSSAGGKHAVKISDNIGKNTGDRNTVERVKRELAYTEIGWMGDGDETKRWG